MLPQLFLGIVVLALVILLMRWLANAPPAALARSVKIGSVALLVGGGVLLAATGRLAWALAAAGALVPWVVRAIYVHSIFRQLRAFFRTSGGGWGKAGSAQPGEGGQSEVTTRFLRMTLDHDSGRLDGEVIDGRLRGRRLESLSLAEAVLLWEECAVDPQSRQVLEAWLDRRHPDWRDSVAEPGQDDGQAGSRPPSGTRMSRDEAYSVLGLSPGASPDEIKAAHRRLMMACHPDHGGSDWLAARINQAKDVLMGS